MSSEGKITFGSKLLERDRQGADHVGLFMEVFFFFFGTMSNGKPLEALDVKGENG